MIRKRLAGPWLFPVLLAPALVIAACGGNAESDGVSPAADMGSHEAALYEAAQDEDAALLYTPQTEESAKALIDAFAERYPELQKVQLLRLATGALSQRYEEERNAGVVAGDVVTSTDPEFMLAMSDKGWFEHLSTDDIPEIANWPAEFVGDTFVQSTGVYPNGILYNTDRIGDEPFEDWTDLLKPELKGEVMLVDPRGIGTFQILTNMLYEEYGADFIRDLGKQIGIVVDSGIPGSQAIAAGEYAALIYTNDAVRTAVSEAGAPVKLFMPDLTTGSEHAVAISTDSDSPNTARLFVNFMLTREGQEPWTHTGFSVLGDDIPGTVPKTSGYQTAWDQGLVLEPARMEEIYGLLGL